MQLTDQHKALLLTCLVTATVVLGTFTFHLKRQVQIAESYYELEPETPEELKDKLEEKEALQEENAQKAETNEAYNENQNHQRFAQAYKPIAPPQDYEFKRSEDNGESTDDAATPKDYFDDSKKVNQDEMDRFNKANDILKQKLNTKGANTKSTMHYSLTDRKHMYLPTPIYLCEEGGKIVVNIEVNARGEVTTAYINSAFDQANECIKEHALEYAKKAQFNSDLSKAQQLGSITFYFQGKR